MFGAAQLDDGVVRAAAEGSRNDRTRVLEALQPQVRVMVVARLSPTPAQFGAVDEITQEVMLALTEGISRLKNQTVGGLKAFVSGIVAHKVSDLLRRGGDGGPVVRSLDSTVAFLSRVGPLWEFLSAGGTSPSSAVGRAELAATFLSKLGSLKPKHREAITMAFFDQLPVFEIGRRMGISRQAASMLLTRAVGTLRRDVLGFVESDETYGAIT